MIKKLLGIILIFLSAQALTQKPAVFVRQSGNGEITINVTIHAWELIPVQLKDKTAMLPVFLEAHYIREKGAPDLPKVVVPLIVSDQDEMVAEVTAERWKEYTDIEIVPSKGYIMRSDDPQSAPYEYGPVYSTNAFYPVANAQLNSPYILRDFRGQTLEIYPFRYNPVTRILRVYSEISLKVYASGRPGENPLHTKFRKGRIASEFDKIYMRHFANYTELNRYTPLQEEGGMLIICHDAYLTSMQPFVEWKNTIGVPTQIVGTSVTGTSVISIKNYITNYYNNNNLIYVLLVGDAEHIPPVTSGVIEGYSDNAYGYLAGSDRYQEVFVGRFSAQSAAHVQTQVQRSIEYEKAHNFTTGWLHRGIGIARNEGAGLGHNGGEADYVHMDLIRNKLLSYTYDMVYREYDGNVPGLPNTTAAQISLRINNGAGIINYCNHGSATGWSVAGYNSSHVSALTNTGKLPFIWSVACLNGQFQGQTCFAETWLRSVNSQGQPVGAVATLMSTINQPWTPPMDAQDEFNDILIESYANNIKRTYGGLSVNGIYKMLDINPNNNGYKTAETWTIFGDPSLKVRTDNAVAMSITHAPHVTAGPPFFELTCNTEGAFATMTRNGQIIGTATCSSGTIAIPVSGLSVGQTVRIAVTAYNRIPYIIDLEVVASGPYANFYANNTSPAVGQSIVFTDASGGGTFSTWEWIFGDGAVPAIATGQGPHTVTYTTPGLKSVSLLVDGTHYLMRTNYINVKNWYTLTIQINGAGSVSVNGSTYTGPVQFTEGTTVNLQAVNGTNTLFTGWSGDLSGTANPSGLLMNANKQVTATFSMAATATYTSGDIPTDSGFMSANSYSLCPGLLTVSIPVGAIITRVDVSYNMTAQNQGWMSEQRSQLRCISPGGLAEPALTSGSGTTIGTFIYNRTNLNIANNVAGGGNILFALHAGRTWSSSGYSGCQTYNNKVDNNTWKVTVYYQLPPSPPIVNTSLPNNITATTAELGGIVVSDGGAAVTERGIFLSMQPHAELTGSKLVIGSGTGSFTQIVNTLNAKTTYYVKAFATNSAGTSYGSEPSFTTPMHTSLTLTGEVQAGEDICFDASEIIFVAGNGGTYGINPGAMVEMVAGASIQISDGFIAWEGAYFHARIATDNDYCLSTRSVVQAPVDQPAMGKKADIPVSSNTLQTVSLFPNPVSDVLYLAVSDKTSVNNAVITIFSATGQPQFFVETKVQSLYHLPVNNLSPGLYILRVVVGNQVHTIRFVKQ